MRFNKVVPEKFLEKFREKNLRAVKDEVNRMFFPCYILPKYGSAFHGIALKLISQPFQPLPEAFNPLKVVS